MNAKEIVLFESSDGQVTLPVEVDVAQGDVWLTRRQIAYLFGRDVKTIGKHINNALQEELSELAERTVAKIATVQKEKNRYVKRQLEHYGLDVVLAVGYRVKSQRGVEFRRWATDILHRYLVDGYAENKQRLRELGQTLSIITRLQEGELSMDQIVEILQSYSRALTLLDDFDHKTIARPEGTEDVHVLSYEECRSLIENMRFSSESDLFGVEKDDSFKASIGDIYAGFGGQDAYPSVEEKAANLLYFVVKNHSFLDGNKRIAAALFAYFLSRNGILFNEDGSKRVSDEVLVAITIMMAESKPQEKEAMVSLVMQFLCSS